MHLSQGRAGQFNRTDHIQRIAFHQDHIGTLHRDIGARTDREAHVGLRQRRSIIDAIAHHADLLALPLQFLDLCGLVARQHVGQHDVDAQFLRNALSGRTVVTG